MKIRELIALLQEEDQEREVILSKDEEGNGYSPFLEFNLGAYKDGNIGLEKLTPEAISQGYTEEDLLPDGVPALILYP